MSKVPPTMKNVQPTRVRVVPLDGIGVELHGAPDGGKTLMLGPLMLSFTLSPENAKSFGEVLTNSSPIVIPKPGQIIG